MKRVLISIRSAAQFGITFPHFSFVADNLLKKNTVAISVNHLTSEPRRIGDFTQIILNVLQMTGARFINLTVTEDILSAASNYFPELVHSVYSIFATAEVSAIFRILVKENVSIRPMRYLLDGLLNANFVVANPLSGMLEDCLVLTSEPAEGWIHKPEVLAAFLRVNMRHYITAQYAGLDQHIMVWAWIRPLNES